MTEVPLLEILLSLLSWVQSNLGLVALAAIGVPLLALLVRVLRAPPPKPPEAAAPEPAAPPEELPPQEEPCVEMEPVEAAPVQLETAPPIEPGLPVPVEVEPPAEPPAEPVEEPVAPVEPIVEPPAPLVVEPPKPVRLRDRLARTSEALVGRLESILGGRKVDSDLLDELEALLFTADLGVQTAESLLQTLRSDAAGGDADRVREILREKILEKLRKVEPGPETAVEDRGAPYVILVLGVNGSGKTTTIGKLAAQYLRAGSSVILGAGDTFRAAAIEQLQSWGERVGCEVIAGRPGADPASVAFDTVKAAKERAIEVAIIDTAGRLQTKVPLMEELSKIVRVIGKDLEGAPHETLLVLDANTGQNAISQAHLFTEAAGVSGLVLTKLDGTATGGVLVGLADEFGIPVRYVGVGEKVEDLRRFSADDFVDALFATGEPG
jgi:fused signal recognition particle receptor